MQLHQNAINEGTRRDILDMLLLDWLSSRSYCVEDHRRFYKFPTPNSR